MPSHTNNKKKKTKSKDKKKSSKSEYYQKTLDIPASPDEFMKATAEHLFKMSQLPAQLLQGPGGEEAFEQYMKEVVKPMDVTPEVIEEIRRTKISDSIMWYVDTKNDVDDNLVLMCNVHLLDNSTFSDSDDSPNDYSIESNKNRIVCQIACCAKECEPGNMAEKELVLGTIAKAIFQKDLMNSLPFMKKENGEKIKPKRILFETSGMVAKVSPELQAMGIPKKYITCAHSEIIQEAAVKHRLKERSQDGTTSNMFAVDPNNNRAFAQGLARDILNPNDTGRVQYVSETPKPLRNFTPDIAVPRHWICRPPANEDNYRMTDLFGWRTNLERAVVHMDEAKVKQITDTHSAHDVREYCEIRLLLTKMASKGLVRACKLLLDYCRVSPDGARDADFPFEWKKYLEGSGLSDQKESPLLIAAQHGHYDVCKILLEYQASIHIKDDITSSIALHHAMSQGHIDVVELLCQHNSDISDPNYMGMDAIDLIEMFKSPQHLNLSGGSLKQCQKIEEILREYDNRCSYCKEKPIIMRRCPCHKERYCGVECQKGRWADHRALHQKVIKKRKESCGDA